MGWDDTCRMSTTTATQGMRYAVTTIRDEERRRSVSSVLALLVEEALRARGFAPDADGKWIRERSR